VQLKTGNQNFTVKVANYAPDRRYIQSVTLNGKPLNRNWLTHQEIVKGGILVITASCKPNPNFGITNQWISSVDMQ
jgi:putative alpha-1,2-mannosidase